MLFYNEGQQLGLFDKNNNIERRFNSLEEIKKIAVQCKRCILHKNCNQLVFGTGNPKAGLMFVGEGPGKVEDEKGTPFVGKAGQLFNRILEAAEINREDVYISNIVKCRPSGNRNPEIEEMKSCLWFLAQEIRMVEPTIIVPLGSIAVKGLLNPNGKITRLRGKWVERNGYYFLPTFHPAALLRNESWKKPTWHDFLKIKKAYKRYLKLKKQGEM
ncbi:uracil-DNA glycosylase [Selenihalanaerobacter shriftii]|uniref:Type-4 uracil-DNA glycosylase n=1 Tax=Selenihalanaerobacter shriftii TaxID=142842 RepID=A0A1T4P8C3_9FIRM|nr:uracil-DNA glycosylase [Selenihalanaerobacter shriftii]SJZ87830.1 DNA polymerase [Selenihalanaerobacter shriftii]